MPRAAARPIAYATPVALVADAQSRGSRYALFANAHRNLFAPHIPSRYDAEARELISDLGVAYKVLANGIPNLNPIDARLLKTET